MFFIAGAVIGCFFANLSSGTGLDYMGDSISSFLSVAGDGGITVRLMDAFSSVIKLPLLVFMLGLTAYGAYLIPFVFTARGFLLAFTCTAFIRLLGFPGLMACIALFLPTNIISLPSLLFLGVQAMAPVKKNYYERALLCLALFIISVLVEAFITPKLLTYIISKFGIL